MVELTLKDLAALRAAAKTEAEKAKVDTLADQYMAKVVAGKPAQRAQSEPCYLKTLRT